MLSRRVEPNFNRTATLDKIDKKEKSCKSCDLQDSVAEREEFYTTLPSSVTRWYSSAVFKHFRLFCTKNGAELAQDKISLKNKNLSDIFLTCIY